MPNYIDGFVFPISRDHVEVYRGVAEAVAEIYLEHGALDYREFIGDDLNRAGTLPFPDLVAIAENETIVFGWVTFASRQERDQVNAKVEADPRMVDLVAPLTDPASLIFDPNRMAYGGFKPLVSPPNENAG